MGTGSDNIQWCVEAANPRIKYLEGNLKRKKETVKLHSRKGFPGGSAGKESACNAGDLGLIPGLGRSPEEGKGYLLQYSGLDSSMDCTVLGVAKSWTGLSNFHFHFHVLRPLRILFNAYTTLSYPCFIGRKTES